MKFWALRGLPWQRAYVERLIGSIRRECLDHVIVFDEESLRRTLRSYFSKDNGGQNSCPGCLVSTVPQIIRCKIIRCTLRVR